MILKTYMQVFGDAAKNFRYSFCNMENQEVVTGTNNHNGAFLVLEFGKKSYRFSRKIVSIEKPTFVCRYPLTSKRKKALGYQVTTDSEVLLQTYKDGIIVGKKWIFNRSVPFTVYLYRGKVYHCFRVGFPNERSHYYCIITPEGETVGIVERHAYPVDDSRSTVYVKHPEMEELTMLVCANETMMVYVIGNGADRSVVDTSAGQYISLTDAEKSLFDKDFIPAVKAMHGIYD